MSIRNRSECTISHLFRKENPILQPRPKPAVHALF